MLATLFTEYIMLPNAQHAPAFFFASAAVFPLLLVAIARGASSRWGASGAAATYMGATLLMIWILQLFPAQPMLAPIMRHVDRMVPPSFPILLVAPALVVDFVINRMPVGAGRLRQWLIAVAAGVAAMVALGVVQWFFAEFLLTEHARNFFFAGDLWDYSSPPGRLPVRVLGPAAGRGGRRLGRPGRRGVSPRRPLVGQLDGPGPTVACVSI